MTLKCLLLLCRLHIYQQFPKVFTCGCVFVLSDELMHAMFGVFFQELEERLRQQHHLELQSLREAHRQNIETLKQQSEQELQTLRFELEDEGKAMLGKTQKKHSVTKTPYINHFAYCAFHIRAF